jgi:hypothetical protein
LTAAFGHLKSKRKTAFAKDVFECILRFLLNSHHEFPMMDLCDFEFVLELILEQADVREVRFDPILALGIGVETRSRSRTHLADSFASKRKP